MAGDGAWELLRTQGVGAITLDGAAGGSSCLLLDRLGEAPENAPASARIPAHAEVSMTAEFHRTDFAIFFDAIYRGAVTEAWVRRLLPWLGLPGDLPALAWARLTAGYQVAAATDVFAPAERDHASMTAVVENEGARR